MVGAPRPTLFSGLLLNLRWWVGSRTGQRRAPGRQAGCRPLPAGLCRRDQPCLYLRNSVSRSRSGGPSAMAAPGAQKKLWLAGGRSPMLPVVPTIRGTLGDTAWVPRGKRHLPPVTAHSRGSTWHHAAPCQLQDMHPLLQPEKPVKPRSGRSVRRLLPLPPAAAAASTAAMHCICASVRWEDGCHWPAHQRRWPSSQPSGQRAWASYSAW